MVSVTIYLEGGVPPNATVAAMVVDNSQRLRESFNKLFRQVFEETIFDLRIEMKGGEKNAAKRFKDAVEEKEEAILLLDVYAHKTKDNKLEELELKELKNKIFFMVREMEAWILAEPQVIEEFGKIEKLKRVKPNQPIEEDKSILGKDIQKINQPSEVLKTILGRYFETKKGKKQKYGKLSNAPTMIELLNLKKLKEVFEDVDSLINYIQSKNS